MTPLTPVWTERFGVPEHRTVTNLHPCNGSHGTFITRCEPVNTYVIAFIIHTTGDASIKLDPSGPQHLHHVDLLALSEPQAPTSWCLPVSLAEMHTVEVAVPSEIRERHRGYGRRQLPALTEPAKADAAVQI